MKTIERIMKHFFFAISANATRDFLPFVVKQTFCFALETKNCWFCEKFRARWRHELSQLFLLSLINRSLSVVNDSGYKLFTIQSVNKVEEIFSSDDVDTRIAERLFSSSLVATVWSSEQNKLKVSTKTPWHHLSRSTHKVSREHDLIIYSVSTRDEHQRSNSRGFRHSSLHHPTQFHLSVCCVPLLSSTNISTDW